MGEVEQLRDLIDGSVDLIYETDARGKFTFVNKAFKTVLGWEKKALLGQLFTILIRPDWHKTLIDHYRHQRKVQAPTTYLEFPAIGPDGREVWLGQRVQAIVNGGTVTGFRAIARDISGRREVEERFHAFLNNAPTVAYMKDASHRFVFANERMTELFGSNIVGRPDSELVQGNFEQAIHEHDAEVLRTGRAIQVVETVPVDGEVRHWLTHKFPVKAADGSTYIGGVGFDLTDRIALENQLAAARDAALVSARQKSEFLANMSHEIRTPMNGVIGLLGVLLDSELPADQRDLAETARSSAESLLHILNDILDFSKIEAGKLTFEVLEFDIRSTVESVVELLADAARKKGLDIGCVVDPDVPVALSGDPGRLRQVLLNVVGNAVKFTERGGVVIQVEVDSANLDSVKLRCRVTDSGLGIPKDIQERLFDPFTQAETSMTRRFGGTGLGLAISRQLVTMMDGEISVDSEPGCGSTFTFTSRFNKVEGSALPAAPAGHAPRVLLVDDNPTTRQLLALQLTALGVPNETADDTFTALAMLRTAASKNQAFELVISDLNMPGANGLSLARFVHADAALGRPRFVLLSATPPALDAARLSELGITSCLRKPLKPRHLMQLLFQSRTVDSVRPAPARPASVPAVSPRVRLLVVDDNPVNQKVAVLQLRKLGYAVDSVGNGLEAVDALERISYDLVLMDCHMPEMDGYEATAEIRRREQQTGRHTPIIAATASASDADRNRCLTAGMDDFATKPIRQGDLAALLLKYLPATRGASIAAG